MTCPEDYTTGGVDIFLPKADSNRAGGQGTPGLTLHCYEALGKGKHSWKSASALMRAQDETFNVGDKRKDCCPTPYSRIGTIFQTERCQLFLPACDSLFSKSKQRPGSPRFCCAAKVEDLCCLPPNDHMWEAFTIPSLAESLQPTPEAAGRAEGALSSLSALSHQCSLALPLHRHYQKDEQGLFHRHQIFHRTSNDFTAECELQFCGRSGI